MTDQQGWCFHHQKRWEPMGTLTQGQVRSNTPFTEFIHVCPYISKHYVAYPKSTQYNLCIWRCNLRLEAKMNTRRTSQCLPSPCHGSVKPSWSTLKQQAVCFKFSYLNCFSPWAQSELAPCKFYPLSLVLPQLANCSSMAAPGIAAKRKQISFKFLL